MPPENEARVYNAVTHPTSNPWITPEEYEEITGEPYVVLAKTNN